MSFKSRQQFTISMGAGVTQVDVTLTAGQDITKTVPLLNGTRAANYDTSSVSVERLGATQYRIKRFASGGTALSLVLTVLEFTGVTITQVPLTYAGGTVVTAAVAIGTMSRTWAVSYQSSGDAFPDGDGVEQMTRTRLIAGPTRVEWTRAAGTFANPTGFSFVCEDLDGTNWTVQAIDWVLAAVVPLNTAIAAVDPTRTFFVGTHHMEDVFGALEERGATATLIGTATHRATHNSANLAVRTGHTFVVQVPAGQAFVQRVTGTMAGGVLSETLALGVPVSGNSVVVYSSSPGGVEGAGSNNSALFNDQPARECLLGTLPTALSVKTERSNSSSQTIYAAEVIDWLGGSIGGEDDGPIRTCCGVMIPP